MNPGKAIEILKKVGNLPPQIATTEYWKANQLGIEALKACLRDRIGLASYDIEWLPGETRD